MAKTEDELRLESEKLAEEAAKLTTKIEEKTTWTPGQITTLMTQLSEIQAQQSKILERLEAMESKPSTLEVSNVVEVDPLEAQKEAEKQRLLLEQEAKDKLNAKPPKHRML